ncbi:Tfp pilus assembly protein PilF [Aequorivita sublithincola DSM 14238]|uniref:Tfp pilus assembly protein PilF n=1 Tax=Aequorivita sublithincola (strain DSM 14238 / LMG 21431 / ACAM 643 / 9-3) TaxID=746697 RepID=I3YVK7_AEQSU|nr:hypothetical protein [Aequorivita sublithincola]AFL79610.1 Tfp pilus assembly protein PilF [Aequorivita sublithincola DSM 14238]AFL81025.1 Tfp pilus assembly protein PilF [Aequorivita sublithincola DSM 14238]
MKKFFKITGIIFGIILIGIIGIGIYGFIKVQGMNKKSAEKAQSVESFTSTDSNEYMQYSIRFNKAGDYNQGFKYLDKAVELDPTLHLGYRGYMKLRFLRDFDGALSDFNRLDSLTPNFNDAPWGENIDFLRGESYYGKKEYEKAIVCFKRNIVNQTAGWADIQSFVYLGICEFKLRNYESSIAEFKKALEQSDKTTEAYYYLSKVYRELDSLPKAREYLEKSKQTLNYKINDPYNEYLTEIYLSNINDLEKQYAE